MTDLSPPASPAPTPARPAPTKQKARPASKPAPRRAKPVRARRALLRPGLLPAVVVAATLLAGVKVGDIWNSVSTGAAFSLVPPSVAQQGVPVGLPERDPTPRVQVAQATPTEPASPPPTTTEPAASPPATAAEGTSQPSGAPPQSFSATELELLQRLQERREQIEQRSRELDQREAMLTAAETRFDQKIAELQKLKQEIQGLLTTVNAEQQAQLDSLVKIYETMKPADAAKIFNSLENNVLLNVISRMKETKAAPVLAAMDSPRAQEVTILLAERKRLPTVPE